MTTTDTTRPPEQDTNKPTHVIRRRIGRGRKAEFETLGVAWTRPDGGFYSRVYGTQIIEGGFYILPRSSGAEADNGGAQ